MAPPLTLGEAVTRRRLSQHVTGGLTVYSTGQLKATVIEEGRAVLSYVDGIGTVAVVFCCLDETDDWVLWSQDMIKANHYNLATTRLPRSFMLPTEWKVELARALKERERKKKAAPRRGNEATSS